MPDANGNFKGISVPRLPASMTFQRLARERPERLTRRQVEALPSFRAEPPLRGDGLPDQIQVNGGPIWYRQGDEWVRGDVLLKELERCGGSGIEGGNFVDPPAATLPCPGCEDCSPERGIEQGSAETGSQEDED